MGGATVLSISQPLKRFRAVLAVIVSLVVLALPPALAAPPARWTVFVYMAADNNLERFSLPNIDQFEYGLPAQGVEVLVFVDRSRANEGKYGGWSGGRLYRLKPDRNAGTIASEVVRDYGPVDSGDPALLQRTAAEVFRTYPAERYATILWNHGGGWASMLSDEDVPGAPGRSTAMTMAASAEALRGALRDSGVPKLALVGFDMCLMGQLQTAAEYADIADVLVASEDVEVGTGWPYDRVANAFGQPGSTAVSVAKALVEANHALNRQRGTPQETLAAWDLTQTGEVLKSLDALIASWIPRLDTIAPAVSKSFFWAEGYAPEGKIQDLRRGDQGLQSVDLLDAVARAQANTGDGPTPESERLKKAVGAMVVANRTSEFRAASKGVAIYAPLRRRPADGNRLKLNQQSRWLQFLLRLAEASGRSSKPPSVDGIVFSNAVSGKPVTSTSFGDDAIAQTTISGDNVLFTTFEMARADRAGGRKLLELSGFLIDTALFEKRAETAGDLAGLLVPEFSSLGSRVQTDGAILSLVVLAGGSVLRPTLDGTAFDPKGNPMAQAPALFWRGSLPPQDVVVMFDLATSRAVAILAVPRIGERIVPRAIEPLADDRLTFLTVSIGPEGSRQMTPAGAPVAWGPVPPSLLLDLPIPGTYTFTVTAETIGGATAQRQADIEIRAPDSGMMDRIKGARSLTEQALAGTWLRPDGHPFLRFRPRTAGGLDVDWLLPDDAAQLRSLGLSIQASLDTTLLPILDLRWTKASGEVVKRESHILLARSGQKDVVTLRSFLGQDKDARGSMVEIRRAGTTAAAPAVPGAPVSPLVGRWEGVSATGVAFTVTYEAGGAFRQEALYPDGSRLVLLGRWSQNGTQVTVDLTQAQPKDLCSGGQCRPVPLGPQTFAVTLQGTDILSTSAVTLRRTRG